MAPARALARALSTGLHRPAATPLGAHAGRPSAENRVRQLRRGGSIRRPHHQAAAALRLLQPGSDQRAAPRGAAAPSAAVDPDGWPAAGASLDVASLHSWSVGSLHRQDEQCYSGAGGVGAGAGQRRGLHTTPPAWGAPGKDAPVGALAAAAAPKKKKKKKKKKKGLASYEDLSMMEKAQRFPSQASVWAKDVAWEVKEDPAVLAVWTKQAWVSLKHMISHTIVGGKLLVAETRIASRILMRLLAGRVLSRRERSLLQRVVTDLFRLVPFSFFIIIPAMEIFLPVALKLFPNMLPSQFADATQVADKKKRRFKARLETARFLQECLHKDIESLQASTKKDDGGPMDLSEFIARVRAGQEIPNELIFEIAKHFKDGFLLDNLPRPQLIAM